MNVSQFVINISCTILAYLKQYDVITKQKQSFLSQNSTTTSLLDTHNDWSLAIKHKRYVDVAFVDFAKAPHNVSYIKLIAKLKSYGITGKLHKWITRFFFIKSNHKD